MTYRAGTVKRTRRSPAQIEQLERQILDVLEEDNPQSIRHVFYRMTDPRLEEPVEKSDRGYRHVQERMTAMRRAGTLPYGWVADTSRAGYHVNTYSDAGDFLRRHQSAYRADLWSDAGLYCEVWCESRSLAGVIRETCRELAVSLYPAGGFASLTLTYESAEFINHVTGRGQIPAHLLYLGDYDPAGVLIDRSIHSELLEHLDPAVDLHFHRLAITPDQIRDMDLPTKPRQKGDRRAQHVESTVEAEAMSAREMRRLLRDAVEALLPPGAIEAARAAEESERAHLEWLANLRRTA